MKSKSEIYFLLIVHCSKISTNHSFTPKWTKNYKKRFFFFSPIRLNRYHQQASYRMVDMFVSKMPISILLEEQVVEQGVVCYKSLVRGSWYLCQAANYDALSPSTVQLIGVPYLWTWSSASTTVLRWQSDCNSLHSMKQHDSVLAHYILKQRTKYKCKRPKPSFSERNHGWQISWRCHKRAKNFSESTWQVGFVARLLTLLFVHIMGRACL